MSETRSVNTEYRRFVWVVAMALLLLVVPKPSSAQSTGTILGTVKDASGGVVPQAKVTIVNTDTNDTRTATTGDDGSFRFSALVTGHYSVRVEREGFKTETRSGMTLEVAQEMVVNTVLEVGTSTQEVTVTGEAPIVNTTNSALGGLVNENKMADLPLNGRNYNDLTFMQPGVNMETNGASSAQLGGTAGTYISSDGGTPRSNLYLLDGANVLNKGGAIGASQSGTTLGVAGIKEFKVVTGVFDASYGNAPGAQVVMVSKGGSNEYHGELFEYLRNSSMDAANFFDRPVIANNFTRIPEFQRNNFGAAGGGPIKKDKTFVYAAYEGLRERYGVTVDDVVPAAGCHGAAGTVITNTACPQLGSTASVTIASVMAGNGVAGSSGILGLWPVANLPNYQYTFPTDSPDDVDWGQIRVDQNISASDTLFGRYTTDRSFLVTDVIGSVGVTNGSAAASAFPEFAENFFSYDQFTTISENHIISPTLLNQFRFSYSRNNVQLTNAFPVSSVSPNGAASLTGPAVAFVPGEPIGTISLSGFASFGAAGNNPSIAIMNTYTMNDDVYYTKGRHSFRFGTEVNHYDLAQSQSKALLGATTFTSLGNFLQGIPSTYNELQFGANSIKARNYMYWVPGFYGQDDWRVSSRLTLNLGLRYEFMPEPYDTGGHAAAFVNRFSDTAVTVGKVFYDLGKLHFSPRVGFAWDVQGNGKTSVRGGFGKYFDIGNMSQVFSTCDASVPGFSGQVTHTNSTNAVMTLPLTFSSSDTIGSVITDYYLTNPSFLKWNLTVERQLPLGIGLQVAYVGTRGIHLYTVLEGNKNVPTAVVNGLPYWNGTEPRQNPNFTSMQFTGSTGLSEYHALQVAANKRVSHGIEFQMSYTFSKNLDNTTGMSSSDCTGAGAMSLGDYFGPGNEKIIKGPSCSDVAHNVRVNVLYHIPNIKSDNFAAKMEHGWWAGIIWSAQTGYAFTPVLGTNRSQSQYFKTNADLPNIATAADAANCPALSATCKYVPVAFNASTITQGNPTQWYNPNMFTMAPMFTGPGSGVVCGTPGTACGTGTTYGTLGNAARGLLRGPGMNNVDFSLNKDTRLPFLGEQGNLEFRAEIFNILNHPNFGMPGGTVFSGKTTDYSPYSETVGSSAGVITTTVTTSRQVQLALKVVF